MSTIRRKSFVNLDALIDLSNSGPKLNPFLSAGDHLNMSLTKGRARKEPDRYSPTGISSSKNRLSAICPKCSKQVKSGQDGVICGKCNAYWHMKCANVTYNVLQENWCDRDFLCENHNKEEIDSSSSNCLNVKISEYSLNVK